jgi:hypothetical protein
MRKHQSFAGLPFTAYNDPPQAVCDGFSFWFGKNDSFIEPPENNHDMESESSDSIARVGTSDKSFNESPKAVHSIVREDDFFSARLEIPSNQKLNVFWVCILLCLLLQLHGQHHEKERFRLAYNALSSRHDLLQANDAYTVRSLRSDMRNKFEMQLEVIHRIHQLELDK